MPWEAMSKRDLRVEFVTAAAREGANVRLLCRRYGVSAKTGYKWLARFRAEGAARSQGLASGERAVNGAAAVPFRRLRQRSRRPMLASTKRRNAPGGSHVLRSRHRLWRAA